MQDYRKIAADRAARPKECPVGASFETEHQRAKKALVKQIEALDGHNLYKYHKKSLRSHIAA